MRSEIIEKLSLLITGAFGLVAALAWNDAIKALFTDDGALYFLAKGGPWIYAILVTILAVIFTIYMGKLSDKAKKKEVNKK